MRSGKHFDVYIGRPSGFGNPFIVGRDGTRDEVIAKHREYMYNNPELMETARALKGKVLGCYCWSDQPCHGDVLIEIADRKDNV